MFRTWFRNFARRPPAPRPLGRPRFRPGLEAMEERIVPQAGQLGFFALDFHFPENAGTAMISVVRGNGTDGTVTVDFATHDETAVAGVNYTATSGTLTFGPGVTQQVINVPILVDGQVNGNQAFGLELHNPGGGASLVDVQSAASVTILDRDGTSDQRFVNDVFLQILHRQADAASLTTYTSLLAQGQTRQQVALAIENTPEARTVAVQDLYITLLGREAESGGLAIFTTFLANGGTLQQVESAILGSDEYFLKAGGDNQSWLESVYQDVLHRLPDPFGEGTFLASLNAGTSRVQIAQLIVTSQEGYTTQVTDYYQNFLDRIPDPVGLFAWVTNLQQGVRTEVVVAGFLGSPEYSQPI
jgi:hypothetical protein